MHEKQADIRNDQKSQRKFKTRGPKEGSVDRCSEYTGFMEGALLHCSEI